MADTVLDAAEGVAGLSLEPIQFRIAPSLYGMFVNLNCDLYMRKAAVVGRKDTHRQTNTVSQRMQQRGSSWEGKLCDYLRRSAAAQPSVVYTDCTHVKDTRDFLRDLIKNDKTCLVHYLYQVTLDVQPEEVPQSLKDVGATISRVIPDLLMLKREAPDRPWHLYVVDAKSSLHMKQSHQAQVAFYAYFLAKIFRAEIISRQMSMGDIGYIWLQPNDASAEITSTMQPFQLLPWLQLVERHLQRDIPRALLGAIEDVSWHLNIQCATCSYLEDCRQQRSDIRALPHISRADSQYLQSVALVYSDAPTKPAKGRATRVDRTARRSVQTLRAALRAAPDERAIHILGESRSQGLLTSVLEDRLIVKGHLCDSLPVDSVGTAVYLTLACDPASDLPYAFALRAVKLATGEVLRAEACAEWTADEAELRRREVALLVRFLTSLCAVVCGKSGPLIIYLWEGLEKYCLSQLVIKALCGEHSHLLDPHPALRRDLCYAALVVLDYPDQWHLPSPAVGADSSRPAGACAPRVCEVTAAYRSLVYLPIAGFYQASEICAWLREHHAPGVTPQSELSLDHVERVWLAGSTGVPSVLLDRLTALRAAEEYLRQVVTATDPALLFNATPLLPDPAEAQHLLVSNGDPTLQRLMFMKSVDLLVRCSTARQKRVATLNNSGGGEGSSGVTVVRYLRRLPNYVHSFALESGELPAIASAATDFMRKCCLCQEDSRLLSTYADYQYVSCVSEGCPDSQFTFASVKEVRPAAGSAASEVLVNTIGRTNFVAGQRYFLFERETDMNLRKSLDSLGEAAAGRTPPTFIDAITDPIAWSRALGADPAAATFAGTLCSQLNSARQQVDAFYREQNRIRGGDSPFAAVGPLTGVQATAFNKLLHETLTVVWGPPGTGKTHFAAKSILNLIEATARCLSSTPQPPRTVRVLVTATTHTAIDEILQKFVTLRDLALSIPNREDTAPWSGTRCKVIKFKANPTDPAEIMSGVEYSQGTKRLFSASTPFLVVGTTVWSLHKNSTYNGDFREKFDVVVIDEASQMPTADALMPLCCLRGDANGRLLVIGDTLQLPPIVAHKFGPPPPGVPPVQGSILECVLRGADNRSVDLAAVVSGRVLAPPQMVKLSENFRMNSALSLFTSRLYGEDYVPSALSRNRQGHWRVRAGSARAFTTLLPGLPLQGAHLQLPALVAVRLVPHQHSTGASTSARTSTGTGTGTAMAPLSDTEVAASSAMQQVEAEAHYVAALVAALASHCEDESDANAAKDRIFVCTPHNVQKAAIKRALAARGHAQWGDIVDTTERMQGQERDVVIICLAVFTAEQVGREVDFLFSKQRLNVAISRAKKACILVYADALVALNPAVIGKPEPSEGYEHLLAFIAAAGASGAKLTAPVVL